MIIVVLPPTLPSNVWNTYYDSCAQTAGWSLHPDDKTRLSSRVREGRSRHVERCLAIYVDLTARPRLSCSYKSGVILHLH